MFIEKDVDVQRVKGRRDTVVVTISAWLQRYLAKPGMPKKDEIPMNVMKEDGFPYTAQGMKKAVEHLQGAMQWLWVRGFCDTCATKEPPMKRIRLSTIPECTQCTLQRACNPDLRLAAWKLPDASESESESVSE